MNRPRHVVARSSARPCPAVLPAALLALAAVTAPAPVRAAGFTDVGAALALVDGPSLAWGDYDNDGDLDLLLAGASDQSPFLVTGVYRNDATAANTPPTAPTNLAVNVVGTRATFSWDAATDAETPAAGRSDNLRVGTSPRGRDIVSPMADPATGTRRVPAMGNTNLRTSWEIELPSAGTFYWSVQAVDGAFAGSPFAPDGSTGATAAQIAPGTPGEGLTRAPNPFSGATTIRFSQAAPGPVSLRIYDVTGRRIRTLDDGRLPAGSFARTWDGRDDGGRPVAAGVYFARLSTAESERSEKVTLIR
jgi:hypothetical protein